MILIVDDHVELLQLLQQSLAHDELQVTTKTNAADALEVLRAAPVQLLVLDLGLPDESGIELCRKLRAEGKTLPILILTARTAVKSRVDCLDAGADDYLTKPFAVAELRARVRALLRRSQASTSSVYRRGVVSLNFATRRAEVNGQEAPITAREWAILEVLGAVAGAVVPRQQLLTRVWNDADESKLASLDVLISRIRRKLGNDVVRTLRGGGYSLPLGSD